MAKYNKVQVKDLPTNLLVTQDGTTIIPEEYDENWVYYVVDSTKTQTGHILFERFNIRFVQKQLGFEIQSINKRETWYMTRKSMNGKLDIKGKEDQQYISLSIMVKNFCEAVAEAMNYEYWGFAMDYLGIDSKERAMFLKPGMSDFQALSNSEVRNLSQTPFFIVICEKALIQDFMDELMRKGYNDGYICINAGGYAVSHLIRLLLEVKPRQQIYIYMMTDFDLNGLQIYLDIRKYFDVKHIGANPDFFDRFGINFDDIKEPFHSTNIDSIKVGVDGMIEDIIKDQTEKDKMLEWANMLTKERAEMNSITALKLDKNLPKMEDFVTYFEECIENLSFNINLYKLPSYAKPRFINQKINEVKKTATKSLEDYISNMGLGYGSDWLDRVAEAKEKYDEFIKENSDYTDDLRDVDNIINNQSNVIMDIINNSDLAKEIEGELERLKIEIIDIINSKSTA